MDEIADVDVPQLVTRLRSTCGASQQLGSCDVPGGALQYWWISELQRGSREALNH